jgi:general L-amino acid transport system substrate-binding protein
MKKITVLAAGLAGLMIAGSAHASMLDTVKKRGKLICGVNTGLSGFSAPDSKGVWRGLDADVCRAVAAEIEFVPTTAQQRFTVLQSGEVDILSRNTTWTLTRDTALGFNFGPTTFFDGQGFMVKKSLGVKSAKELDGATICVQPGTTTELNLADYFRANNMKFKPVVIEKLDEVNAAFFSGRCDVLTTDRSGLASVRATMAPNPKNYVILPEIISKEPLGPLVRHGDDQFFDIMKWTVMALFDAEEKGVTQANVDDMVKNSKDPEVQRMLGVTPGMGKALGLDQKWAYNAIKAVGNYGEIFARNVGPDTPLGLERGLNQLWTKGGLIYGDPIH